MNKFDCKIIFFFFLLTLIISCDGKENKKINYEFEEIHSKKKNHMLHNKSNIPKVLNIKIENNKIYNIKNVLLEANEMTLKEVYYCFEKDSCTKIRVEFNNTIIRFNYSNDSVFFANTKEKYVDDEQFLIGKYIYEGTNIIYLFFMSNEDLSDELFTISIDTSGKILSLKKLFNKGGDGMIRFYPVYISSDKNKITIFEITEEYTSENMDTFITTTVKKEIILNKKR